MISALVEIYVPSAAESTTAKRGDWGMLGGHQRGRVPHDVFMEANSGTRRGLDPGQMASEESPERDTTRFPLDSRPCPVVVDGGGLRRLWE